MTCEKAQTLLMSYLTGETGGSEKHRLENHIESCNLCAGELHTMRGVWQALEAWEDKPVPAPIEQEILNTAGDAAAAATDLRNINRLFFRKLLKPIAPLAMGLAAAVFSAGVLSSRMNLSEIHPLGLTAVGALWTGIYGIIFYILFVAGKTEAGSWRDFARASIAAIGIFLAFTLISPLPSSVNFCRYYAVTQPIIERISIGGSFFVFGALYALIPMIIATYFSGSRSGNHPFAKGSLAGVMFVMLLAPSIYLQCAPFAIGVLLVWFGGALLGSVVGGIIGYWVRYRFAGN